VVVRAWLPSHAFFLPEVPPLFADDFIGLYLGIIRETPGFSLYLGSVFCNMRGFPAHRNVPI
jgi:hypothetical protein